MKKELEKVEGTKKKAKVKEKKLEKSKVTDEKKKKISKKEQKKLIYLIVGILLGIFSIVIGVLVFNKKEVGWVQEGDKLINGDVILSIGDYYEYDESNGGKISGLTDVKWRVLGLDNESNLLIVSDRDVSSVTFGSSSDLAKSQKDYLEGTYMLNKIASKYGKGENAISARSINILDIDKVTGVNIDYTSNNLSTYDNVVTYSNLKSKNPYYKTETGLEGSLMLAHDKFVWFDVDNKKWTDSTTSSKDEVTVTNTWYAYSTQEAGDKPLLDSNSKKFEMLFSRTGEDAASYWLAGSSFIYTTPSYLSYGYQNVMGDSVNYSYLLFSNGVSRERELGVRVVVTIDSEK